MASTLTRRGAEISLRALSLGAADYIPKPETTREDTNSAAFHREFIEKIRHLGHRSRWARRPLVSPASRRRTAETRGRDWRPARDIPRHLADADHVQLRPFSSLRRARC